MRRRLAWAVDLLGIALVYLGGWLSYRVARRIRSRRDLQIHIDHPSVDADGRATSYIGRVSVRGKTVAQTEVMTDDIACLRAVEALEAKVLKSG